MKTHLLNRLLLASLLTLAAPGLRADEEQDLLATLQTGAGIPQKCAACQRLRFVGTAKAVPALAALLGEDRTGHAARYALEGMPYAEAGAALRQAFAKSTGLTKAGLIDSLGWRRDTTVVPQLIPLLTGADATIAAATATALGRIGGPEAASALSGARDLVAPMVRTAVLQGLLKCAEQLWDAKEAPFAAALYRTLMAEKYPAPIRHAAWRGLALSDARQRTDLVTKAILGEDLPLQAVALKVLRELNDAAVVKACLRQWNNLPAESQLAVLDAHLKFGAEALPTVRTAIQSPHLAVRLAAWQALGDLGDASTIPALAKAAASGEPTEREAARETLARLRGNGVRAALLQFIATAAPAEKAEGLRSLGERGDTEAARILVQNAATGSGAVRLAALESLRKIAVADTITPLMDIAAKSKSEEECGPVLKALYAVCQASRDKDQTARSMVEALGRFPVTERRMVLPLLAELATPAALDAALAATRDADAELVKESVRVLAQWPNAAPAARLLELARASNDSTLQALALRGCIEVAGQEPDPVKRLATLQQAMATAKRPDEKKQALGQIGQIPTPEALEVVMAGLTDPALANEAGLAAVTIAEKLNATNPQLAVEVVDKVLAQCKTPEILKRAWALRGKPASAGGFIQDWQVSGPYRQAGAGDALTVFKVAFAPEKPGEAVQWKPMPRGDMLNLMAVFGEQAGCAAYLRTQVIAAEDTAAALLMGSDDGIKAWVNGEVVHGNNIDRGAVVDQDMAPIKLKKGVNDLMLKVTQGGGGWAACARIAGTDGKPIPGLKIQVPR